MIAAIYDSAAGPVEYLDLHDPDYSKLCQPRDIQLVTPVAKPDAVREQICIDIRRTQGCAEIGIARNLKWR